MMMVTQLFYSLVWLCPQSFSSIHFFSQAHVGEVIIHYFVSSIGLSYMPTLLFIGFLVCTPQAYNTMTSYFFLFRIV